MKINFLFKGGGKKSQIWSSLFILDNIYLDILNGAQIEMFV